MMVCPAEPLSVTIAPVCGCVFGLFGGTRCARCPACVRPRRRVQPRQPRPQVSDTPAPWDGLTVYDYFRGDRRYAPSLDRALDLSTRWRDVLRITRSHGSLYRACVSRWPSSDDLDQEVLTRVIARQGMRSRYDPDRASVSKYLYTLTRSILMNLVDKHRASEHLDERLEQAHGASDPDDGSDLAGHLADLVVAGALPACAPEVARLLVEGRKANEIAEILAVDRAEVSAAVQALRQAYEIRL